MPYYHPNSAGTARVRNLAATAATILAVLSTCALFGGGTTTERVNGHVEFGWVGLRLTTAHGVLLPLLILATLITVRAARRVRVNENIAKTPPPRRPRARPAATADET